MPLVAPEAWRPPVEFWGCDPVWRSSVKILAVHLARLPWAAEGDVCWLNNHPIRDVDIVGIVVGLDPSQPREAEAKVGMTLDDGCVVATVTLTPTLASPSPYPNVCSKVRTRRVHLVGERVGAAPCAAAWHAAARLPRTRVGPDRSLPGAAAGLGAPAVA